MINCVFSKVFIHSLEGDHLAEINNINKDLVELIVAGIFAIENRDLIWVVGENENLGEKQEKLKLWLKLFEKDQTNINVYISPFEDPYINNSINLASIGPKVRLVSDILDKKKTIIITTLSTLSIGFEPWPLLKDFFFGLKIEDDINRDQFIKRLIKMGYQTRNIVEDRGEIAWRGSVVDVFPVDKKNPLRIEIEGNKVVSIRVFDSETQMSLTQVSNLLIPVSKFFLHQQDNAIYIDNGKKDLLYLTELIGNYRMVVSDKRNVEEEFKKLLQNYEKIYKIALKKKKNLKKVSEIFNFSLEGERIINISETYNDILSPLEWIRLKKCLMDFNMNDIQVVKEKIESSGYKLFVFSDEKKITENLKEHFEHFEYRDFNIPFSFENKNTKSLFLTRRNFQFFEKVEKFKGQKSENLMWEIQINDLVVHKKHGIGKFVGFERLAFERKSSDFLKIEYLNREYLYVPVYELHVLSKYVSFEGYLPRMDKLGGQSWELKKKRARKSIINFARDLLELYAMRKSIRGESYVKDPELEDQLQQQFQYVETEDQKRVIREVIKDLESENPMDRLICGDVSFGKTEVAIRAAFRVVTNGMQVALLCPTTILAYQHYVTFKTRFSEFPINIKMLSRMVPRPERGSIYEGLETGRIDIVIGTHSLISKEIKFKNLGLYIIDEEQRFGVFQKEKLKKTREEIDVLTLTATPIPRTLSLSLAGLQDISTIQTPPIGRIAIKNYVGYFSKDILISAVLNEVERDGLVFIVYNRIDKIWHFKEDLQKWLPDISMIVIHAKMRSESIEKNLLDFINKKFRVLISTTIIENGIDIPHVNTLVVVNAERFGLTQLYQLRGRIGRGSRQAYAYFLIQSLNVSDKARSRLDAIREFAELGSGYKLAEFDLRLRGAGSLLGNKQHGHIEALGFDYYHQMLNRTVKDLKGEMEQKKEPNIKIHFSYSIDKHYIKNTAERIGFYKRILEAADLKEIENLKGELIDRYGRLHQSVDKIFYAGMVRVLVQMFQLDEVEVFLNRMIIKTTEPLIRQLIIESGLKNTFKTEMVDENTFIFHFKDHEKFINEFMAGFLQK